MWNRSELKFNAKKNLSGSYATALIVSLVAMLLTGNAGLINFRLNDHDFERLAGLNVAWPTITQSVWFQLILASLAMASLVVFLFRIFISTAVEVGEVRWYSRNRESKPTPAFSQLFSLFQGRSWLPTVGAMIWMRIWYAIWSILPMLPVLGGCAALGLFFVFNPTIVWPSNWSFGPQWHQPWNWQDMPDRFNEMQSALVEFFQNNPAVVIALIAVTLITMILSVLLTLPVINRHYAYRMTPWILADNPRIGCRRALKLSRQMTNGHKFELFVLDLSFIGWFLLGLILFVIGLIFVRPYYSATVAEAYAVLRKSAVERGLVTMEELGFQTIAGSTEVEKIPVDQPTDNQSDSTPADADDSTPDHTAEFTPTEGDRPE